MKRGDVLDWDCCQCEKHHIIVVLGRAKGQENHWLVHFPFESSNTRTIYPAAIAGTLTQIGHLDEINPDWE